MLKQPNPEKFSAILPAADSFHLVFAVRSGELLPGMALPCDLCYIVFIYHWLHRESLWRELWHDIQRALHDDVATIDLIAPQGVTIFNKKVKNHTLGVVGINASFADVYVEH
jgi:hypothetical protein